MRPGGERAEQQDGQRGGGGRGGRPAEGVVQHQHVAGAWLCRVISGYASYADGRPLALSSLFAQTSDGRLTISLFSLPFFNQRQQFVLGKVIDALNAGEQRVPFRDSKLTRLLQ